MTQGPVVEAYRTFENRLRVARRHMSIENRMEAARLRRVVDSAYLTYQRAHNEVQARPTLANKLAVEQAGKDVIDAVNHIERHLVWACLMGE